MEAFCADHPSASIEDVLYNWPASKFEALYGAYAKRKIADELSQRRAFEMAALWGNTNLDSKEKPKLRQELMEEVDEQYSRAIASLYGESINEPEQADMNDPFFAAMKIGQQERELPSPTVED